jgi:diguanylate cyclase (GGDEF)-like protein
MDMPTPEPPLAESWQALFQALAARDLHLRRALVRLADALPEDVFAATVDCRIFAARSDAARCKPVAAADLGEFDPTAPLDRDAVARRLVLGIACARAGQLAEAMGLLAASEQQARFLSDRHLLIRALSEAARVYAIRGESHLALGAVQEAIALATEFGDRQAQAENLLTLGFFFGERDEPEPYLRHTQAALELFETLDDPAGRAMSHCNLAGGLSRLERFDEARHHYARSRELATAQGLEYVLALCLAGEGGVLCRTGDLEHGRDHYLQSNAILGRLGRTFQVVRHLHLLGQYLLLANRFDEARATLETAVEGGRTHSFRSTLAQSLELLSQAAERQGDLQASLRFLRERLEVQRVDFEDALASKIELLNQRHQLETAERAADLQRQSNEQLRRVNQQLVEALARQNELQQELIHLSQTDPLTGLSNRRHLREQLEHELTRITRHFRPLTVILLDIDRFKRINDQHGHATGDEVLVEFARRLREVTRAADSVARWGGEEFCVALFDTDLLASKRPAEAILRTIRDVPFETRAGPMTVTVSMGVATLCAERFDVDGLISDADAALYLAKSGGRDRVVYARSPETPLTESP